jgi:hypothetical protein
MLLQNGERPVSTDLVNGFERGMLLSGTLHLTDRRIVFEARTWEVGVGWITRTMFDVYLHHISNVIALPGQKGKAILRLEGSNGWSYNFETPQAQNWARVISQWKGASAPPPPPAHLGQPSHVTINVPQPTVYLHCKHCGKLNGGGASRCSSCGAAL